MTNNQMAGSCIFCGGHGLTKEHLWANWLRQHLPRTEEKSNHFIKHLDKEISTGKLHRPGDLHSQKLRIVCSNCNNNWMSRLQMAVKPLLISLLQNRWSAFSIEEQSILSAWAGMFTMVYEFADVETVAVPREERTRFMVDRALSDSWRVWIGKIDLGAGHPGMVNHFGVRGRTDDGHFGLQSTGFTVGNIFFQTFYQSQQLLNYSIKDIMSPLGIASIQTPTAPFDPTNLVTLDLQGFYSISNIFGETFGVPMMVSVDSPQ